MVVWHFLLVGYTSITIHTLHAIALYGFMVFEKESTIATRTQQTKFICICFTQLTVLYMEDNDYVCDA